MKKAKVVNNLEKNIDHTLEALYKTRDDLEEVEDIELDELVNEVIEDIEAQIAEKVEQIREHLDKIFV